MLGLYHIASSHDTLCGNPCSFMPSGPALYAALWSASKISNTIYCTLMCGALTAASHWWPHQHIRLDYNK